MNISIFASIGCQNLGDELILKNEITLLQQEFGTSLYSSDISLNKEDIKSPSSMRNISAKQEGEIFFKVASYDPENPIFDIPNTRYFEYFPLGIKQAKNLWRNIHNFFTFLKVIAWSDIVVIGGGGIIYDSELQSVGNPLKQWLFRVSIAKLLRKKVYFYALGIDIKDSRNNKILKKLFKNAWKLTVRDTKSQEQLEHVGISSEIVDDPVMSESGRQGESQILGVYSSKNFTLKDFANYDFHGKEVGLALRKGYIGSSGDERVERLLVEELCQYIEQKGGKIVFLPHSLHARDIQANDATFMKDFITPERNICGSLQEVYKWYRSHESDPRSMILSMRLHSIILSYVYGIDQIVLSYSQKTDEAIKKLSK